MTTSHSSPSPAGSVSPRLPAGSGSDAVGRGAADLEADPLLHLVRDRVAEGGEELRHQQQVVVERELGALQLQQEVLLRGRVEAAEAPGEGQPLEGAQPRASTAAAPAARPNRGSWRPARRRRRRARRPAGRRCPAPSPRRSRSGSVAQRPKAPAGAVNRGRRGGRCGRPGPRARARAGRGSRRRGS